jgi:transposase
MIIIGCDYHPGFQQIAFVDSDTGELSEARLGHKEEVEQFYRELSKRGVTVRVGAWKQVDMRAGLSVC